MRKDLLTISLITTVLLLSCFCKLKEDVKQEQKQLEVCPDIHRECMMVRK
jgi:hypothetical protein